MAVAQEGDDACKTESIVVLGSTGLGKSSLIKAITGLDVHVSSGPQSDTKHAQVFRHPQANQIFVDTMGAEDSEEKESDEAILRKVLHTIQKEGANHIKIIWVVKKETRMTSNLQVQARFIQAFANSIEENAWDSVMVVIKEGENLAVKDDDTLDCQGALAAAAEFGAGRWMNRRDEDGSGIADLPRVGYTCLDWLTGRRQERKIAAVRNQAYPDRFEDGLLFEGEIVDHVLNMLQKLPSMNMQFRKQKCRICGVEGDNRCVPVKCHEQSFRVHPQINNLIHLEKSPVYKHPHALQYDHIAPIVNFHDQATHSKHAGHLQYFHSGSQEYYHSGSVSSFHGHSFRPEHTGTKVYYHPRGTYTDTVPGGYYHPKGLSYSWRRTKKIYDCCQGAKFNPGCTLRLVSGQKYSCCSRIENSPGCQIKYSCCGKREIDGCSGKYPCCGRGKGSSGCASRYSCCSRSGAGCQPRMSCCHSYPGSRGCNSTYSCCGRSSSNATCSQTKHSCCERPTGTTGCKQKHSCCERPAGSIGCHGKYVCCGKQEGSKGCKGEFVCCKQPVQSAVDGCAYACCRQAVGAPECQEQCQRCHGVWGNSEGCTIRRDLLPHFHDMIELE